MLEKFSFDIIILIVIFYSIIIGLVRGFYKQLLATIALAIPLIAIYFLNEVLSNFKFLNNIFDYAYKGGRYFLNLTYATTKRFLVIILGFIIFHIIIKILINIFFTRNKYYIAPAKPFSSRLVGVLLALGNGYFILILILVLISPLIPDLGTSLFYTYFLKLVPKTFILRMG